MVQTELMDHRAAKTLSHEVLVMKLFLIEENYHESSDEVTFAATWW